MSSFDLEQVSRALRDGKLTRRDVLRKGALAGLTAPAIAALLAACGSSSSSSKSSAASTSTASTSSGATSTTASSSPAAGGASASPTSASASTTTTTTTSNTPGLGRGKGGELKLLWWQAPTLLNVHFANGTTSQEAASIVQEPLAEFAGDDAHLVPKLAAEIPSYENGGVAKDGMSVTWKLKQGVKWSDGEPFTSKDVKFTYDYITNKDAAAVTIASYLTVDTVETPDDYTVKVTFKKPNPAWYQPFCGYAGYIVPEHILKNSVGKDARNAPFNLKPVGTTAYKTDKFVPGDQGQFSINDNYREPDKPFFSTINLKGGGDATSAARAVFQTKEVDYGWNLQVTPDVLKAMQTGSDGQLLIFKNLGLEMILINQSDPNKEVDGQKSHFGTPHPFQSDLKVRQAYAMAVQRDVIVNKLYGPAGTVAVNRLAIPPRFVSKNTSWKYDLDAANKLLDDAGWMKGSDGTRAKNGVKMNITYATTSNPVRNQTQEIVKAAFQKLGINVTLKGVDASVFFSSDTGNNDTANHFYTDIEELAQTPGIPYRIDSMHGYYGAPDNIAQKENQWSGDNIVRWANAEYDKAWDQATTELDEATQNQLFIKMNDLVVNDVVVVPMVVRNGVSAAAKGLKNMEPCCWSSELWNLANWVREA